MAATNKTRVQQADDETESFTEYIIRTSNNAFVDNLPMQAIGELPKFYMYAFGTICQVLILLCFAYFVVLVYKQGVEQKFMSLTTDSGDCDDIIKYVNGDYFADETGNWEGTGDYDYSRAIYEMDLIDSALTMGQYQDVIFNAYTQLNFMGKMSKGFDLSFNLIIFISWQMTCDGYDFCDSFAGQSFALAADSSYMFHVSHQSGTYSSVIGDCNYTLATYDLANAEQTISMSYEDFIRDPVCTAFGDPLRLGYDDVLDGNQFDFVIDVRTLSDCFAACSTVLFLPDISVVSDVPTINITFNGFLYEGDYHIDTFYPGMEPMFCIYNTNGTGDGNKPHAGSLNQLCFLQQGNTTGLPLFMHYGSWQEDVPMTPRPCWCGVEGYGSDEYCSSVDLISGFLFYNTPEARSLEDQARTLLAIVIRAPTYYAFNKLAYNASWASAASSFGSTDPIYKDPTFREDAYRFCWSSLLNMSCSIVSVNVYGNSLFDKALTEYMYILSNGSCNDVFSMPTSTLENLMGEPPTPFIENYYECTLTSVDAFINAVGIASGNTGALVPVAIFCLLPLLYMWLNVTGHVNPKEEYDRDEKNSALEFLAIQLLRSRDGKTRGMKKKSCIKDLASDLLFASHTDGGYPDSDDSDEDDDFEASSAYMRSKSVRTASKTSGDGNEDGDVELRPVTNRRSSKDVFLMKQPDRQRRESEVINALTAGGLPEQRLSSLQAQQAHRLKRRGSAQSAVDSASQQSPMRANQRRASTQSVPSAAATPRNPPLEHGPFSSSDAFHSNAGMMKRSSAPAPAAPKGDPQDQVINTNAHTHHTNSDDSDDEH